MPQNQQVARTLFPQIVQHFSAAIHLVQNFCIPGTSQKSSHWSRETDPENRWD
jgi:hypothetical protein